MTFIYGWSVLKLRFGLFILSFYPVRSFVRRVEADSEISGICFISFR